MAVTLGSNQLLSAPTGQISGIQDRNDFAESIKQQTRAIFLVGRPDLSHFLKLFHNLKHRRRSSGERQTTKEVS